MCRCSVDPSPSLARRKSIQLMRPCSADASSITIIDLRELKYFWKVDQYSLRLALSSPRAASGPSGWDRIGPPSSVARSATSRSSGEPRRAHRALAEFYWPLRHYLRRLPTFVSFDHPADPSSIKILRPSLKRTGPESLSVVKATFTASDRPYVPALDHLFQLLPWLQRAVAEEGLIWGPDPRRNPIKQEVYSAEFAKEKS